MNLDPTIENRKRQYYVAVKTKLRRKDIPSLLPPLIPELFKWIIERDIKSSGPPFFSYSNMEKENMTVEVGIPVEPQINGSKRIHAGIFPEGKYAIITYFGNYGNLYKIHSRFIDWAERENISLVGPRIEFYPTDPVLEPNTKKWKTIIINQIVEK